ncbi:hypothetical protein [Jeotgalibaca ciconiae]|uniref:hypothetical protein n=1 Tax=Jeotgalibaca ciconiae TaxID=2496265 RepID=UPI0013DF5C3F|nr:hypothetical protein [Jeotgalibaca ciconiae]
MFILEDELFIDGKIISEEELYLLLDSAKKIESYDIPNYSTRSLVADVTIGG